MSKRKILLVCFAFLLLPIKVKTTAIMHIPLHHVCHVTVMVDDRRISLDFRHHIKTKWKIVINLNPSCMWEIEERSPLWFEPVRAHKLPSVSLLESLCLFWSCDLVPFHCILIFWHVLSYASAPFVT